MYSSHLGSYFARRSKVVAEKHAATVTPAAPRQLVELSCATSACNIFVVMLHQQLPNRREEPVHRILLVIIDILLRAYRWVRPAGHLRRASAAASQAIFSRCAISSQATMPLPRHAHAARRRSAPRRPLLRQPSSPQQSPPPSPAAKRTSRVSAPPSNAARCQRAAKPQAKDTPCTTKRYIDRRDKAFSLTSCGVDGPFIV